MVQAVATVALGAFDSDDRNILVASRHVAVGLPGQRVAAEARVRASGPRSPSPAPRQADVTYTKKTRVPTLY
jgi:hypothetical protein